MDISKIRQGFSRVIAGAGVAGLACSSIVIASGQALALGDAMQGHAHQFWSQPETRDRDRAQDRDRDRDRLEDRERPGAGAPNAEAKAIDMRRVTTARQVLGADVFSSVTNESIGTASDLIISTRSGDIEWVIVDKGALLEDLVAIGMDEVEWDPAQGRFTTSITEEGLDRMPTFEAEGWSDLRHESWYGSLEAFVSGDERETLGVVRHVRAEDILGQPLLANPSVPDGEGGHDPAREDAGGDVEDDEGTEVDRSKVAEVHDIVLGMGIERAPIVIARSGGLMEEKVDRAVPINAVRWERRDPVLMHVTDTQYEALAALPDGYPGGVTRATHMLQSFRDFNVPALIKDSSADPAPRRR